MPRDALLMPRWRAGVITRRRYVRRDTGQPHYAGFAFDITLRWIHMLPLYIRHAAISLRRYLLDAVATAATLRCRVEAAALMRYGACFSRALLMMAPCRGVYVTTPATLLAKVMLRAMRELRHVMSARCRYCRYCLPRCHTRWIDKNNERRH